MAQLSLGEVIQHIGYLPQDPNDLLFAESVLEEIKITLSNHRSQLKETEIAAFLMRLGLEDKKDQYPRDLSVGERQRTALAAISVHQPQILLVDEPTRGLDYSAKQNLSDLFRLWRDQGQSILLVTHDIEFAAGIADRVAILENGRFLFVGEPKVAFTQFPGYQTQTSQLFPKTHWITPGDVKISSDSKAK
jgi:energy-coupling factor transport system ATP-binding protein